jgi:hypothetical protein
MYRLGPCYQALLSYLISAVRFEIGPKACFGSTKKKKKKEERKKGENRKN